MDAARAQARVGRVLKNKWRLDGLIGIGGMAAVYAATHRNGIRVAVKMMHPEIAANPDIRARFLREGYLANSVEHAGTVRVLDDDADDDGSVFLVMELLVGETLETRWQRMGRRLPIEEVLPLAVKLLDVLAAAHEKGIVHRDIKPENVFITQDGALKILDFGIARLRDAGLSQTMSGALLGTPAFMSPEQALGKMDEIDGRADVWAAGATLFTLLAGRWVHEGNTGNEILLSAMTRPAPPLAEVAPHVPPDVCAILDRALASDRGARWESARAMQRALRECKSMLTFGPTAMSIGDVKLPPAPETSAAQTQAGVSQSVAEASFSGAPRPVPWKALAIAGVFLLGGGIAATLAWPRLHHAQEGANAPSSTAAAEAPSAPPAITSAPPPASVPSASVAVQAHPHATATQTAPSLRSPPSAGRIPAPSASPKASATATPASSTPPPAMTSYDPGERR